ncbi:MAG TPA: diaminopimelate decarboxylase [Flavobacteriales bacterium]|nr:diaminopimelate decarboxylase [Flavobacteriales bacterium]
MALKSDLLMDVANQIGTPVYVYDKENMINQVNKLEKAFTDLPAEIHYAMKANEHPEILKIFKDKGIGADAVSPNEINRAMQVGFDKSRIIYTPSCPSEEDLHQAFKLGIHTHIGAIEYLDFVLENYPETAIGLRINPGNSIGGNQKIATAHNASKFGIPVNQLSQIKNYLNKGLLVDSLHLHTGSDVKTWEDLARSVDVLFDFAKHFPDLKYLDFGSGFKVKYHPDDVEINLPAYATYIKQKLDAYNKPVKIKFEPGKFLVSEAGVLLVKVNVVKKGFDKSFVGVDSGFHHLIRPMYYEAYHHIVNLSNNVKPSIKYDVVGVLCEEDTFAYDRLLAPVRKDDILMIQNAGAYGYVMASTYNLRDLPKQVLVEGNSFRQI